MNFVQPSHFGRRICITFTILTTLFISLVYLFTIHYHKWYSSTLHFDIFEQSHVKLAPKLQWCKENPFLTSFDKKSVINSETKWHMWDQYQLTRTFDFLKKFSQSPNETLREFTRVLYPTDELLLCPYNNKTMKRYGSSRDAGKLLCGLETLSHDDTCIVYSLGSADNFEFEESILLQTQCAVHTFDCTSSPPKRKINRLHFHKICLGEDSPLQYYIYPQSAKKMGSEHRSEETYMTFDKILKLQNHSKVHVLKMDIEGGEYSVFTDLLMRTSRSNLPYQISFESHWWNRDIYHAILHISMFSQLRRSGYRLLQYELNGSDEACVEWTFIRLFC